MALAKVLTAVGFGALVAAGCGQDSDLGRVGPEVVPAGEVSADSRFPTVARYWAEVRPTEGRIALYEIHPGNVIYPGVKQSQVSYDYTGTAGVDPNSCGTPPCLPSTVGNVTLFTAQGGGVTYVDSAGLCYSNGTAFPDRTCGGLLAPTEPCAQNLTFCGPIEMISNVTFGQAVGAMPNVVLQVAPSAGTQDNAVAGCNDEDPAGAANGRHGLCAFTNAAKVDDPTTSTLTSLIPGDGINTFGCSFCYGNQQEAVASGLPGLQDTVLSDPQGDGRDAVLASVNTDKVVLVLQNDGDLDLVFTVRYATPALNPAGSQIDYDDTGVTPTCASPPCPASCLTRGATRMTLNGGSFGPPGACLAGAQPVASCPQQGAPAAAYTLTVPGFATAQSPASWSDTFLQHTPAALTTTECGVTVNTPAGNSPTSEDVAVCDNQWRSWTPTSAPVRIGASAGVLSAPSGNRFIVMVSGRTSVNTLNAMPAAGVRTQLLPVPSCANPTPTWTAAVNAGPVAPPSRWGASYAVLDNALYIVGGTTNGGSCTRSMRRMTLTDDVTANWTAVATLPDTDTAQNGTQGLCQGSLQVVRDSNGKAWLVLTGGTTTPVPQTNCQGGESPSLRTYVLDPLAASPVWVVHSAVPAVDNNGASAIFRFGSTGASNTAGTSALVVGGSDSTSTPGGSLTTAATISISTAGVPTFTASGSAVLPSGIYRAAATLADGFVYLVGGSTALSGATCDTTNRGQLPSSTQLLRIPQSFAGPWSTLANLPTPRAEHVVVAAESTGGTEDKLYVIGGHNSAAGQTAVLEYTP